MSNMATGDDLRSMAFSLDRQDQAIYCPQITQITADYKTKVL